MRNDKQDIKKLDIKDYYDIVAVSSEKPFRAKQLSEWLWKKHVKDFNSMTNLSAAFREYLNNNYYISSPEVISEQKSIDGTIKIAFRLFDDAVIEGVIIPSKDRLTACISSQVGCALGCMFCATAGMGFVRNLHAYEIYDQLAELNFLANTHFNGKINNVVLMGMGEPLLNYTEVKKAISLITSGDGMEMSPSRITLSTAGIVQGINQMANDEVKYNLAISLHTANEAKRSRIMPVSKQNNLGELRKAIKHFHEKTKARITYEYLFMDGFNDSREDAEEFAEFCKISPCKINIIEYNKVDGSKFKAGSRDKLELFAKFLESKNLIVNIRKSKGSDIDASCGQLAHKVIHKNRK